MIVSVQQPQSFTVNMQLLPTLIITLQPPILERLATQLHTYISNAPKLFTGANAILDLHRCEAIALDLALIVSTLKNHQLTVIGVRHCPETLLPLIDELHLPIVNHQKPSVTRQEKTNLATLFYNKMIRSGQQVYAQDRDLVVVGSVSPGAEIIADGDIHVYGVMGGKAIAGASGKVTAQFFIQQFNGELCAIAGNYRTFDHIPQNEPIHGYIKNNQLQIDCMAV